MQIAALKSIFDLLQVYGLETFKVTPAEQAILEAEESVLEAGDDDGDDDTDDVSDDVNIEDKEGPDREIGDEENGGVDEQIIDEAQKSVSSVFSVLVKLLDREVGLAVPT